MRMFEALGAPKIVATINTRSAQIAESCDAAMTFVQRFFNALARMDRQKEVKPDAEWAEGLCACAIDACTRAQATNY
jgi:hypothetical protein